jgi:EAL domain-containing protein (putative c-di-GMP-specific phosphodiesterase class I)
MDRRPDEPLAFYFQPLVSLSAGRIIGFTAHGVQPHHEMLRAACAAAARWPNGFTLGVALPPAQWRDPTIGLRVLSILGETGLPPARLELEIVEAALDSDTRTIHRTIEELRQSGILIALGGRGTAATLPPFCFDTIKLDRTLVQKLGRDCESDRIADALIALAEEHGLVTAAEGIASAAQRDILNAKGCAEGQGVLFGRPITASEIPALLRYPSLADAVA